MLTAGTCPLSGGLVLTSGRVGSVDQTDTQSLRVSGSRAGNAGEVADAVALKEVCSSGTSTSSSRSAAPAMPNAQATAMAVVRLSTNIIQGRTAPARSLRKLFWNHWLFCASAGVPRLTATLSDQGSSLCCPPACEAFNYQRKIDFDICFFFPPRTAARMKLMMLLTGEGTHDQLMSREQSNWVHVVLGCDPEA